MGNTEKQFTKADLKKAYDAGAANQAMQEAGLERMIEFEEWFPWFSPEKVERFKKPTGKELIDFAIVFNDGVLDTEKLADMVALATFITDRLYENGDVKVKTAQEILDETMEDDNPF